MKLVTLAAALLLGCGPTDPPAADAECVHDSDCALLPYVTCCGECPPAPPFDVGTRSNLDAIFIELETFCAEHRRACAPPACDPVPVGCTAKAVCVAGRCAVESDGCGRPTI